MIGYELGPIVIIALVIFSIIFAMFSGSNKNKIVQTEPINLKEKSTEELKKMLDDLSNQLNAENVQRIMPMLKAIEAELSSRE